jgi:alpha-tubulin suppressor-like RCC1 family protein
MDKVYYTVKGKPVLSGGKGIFTYRLLPNIRFIAGGQYHSIGLDKNGTVWGWGYNNRGQLGDNSVTSRLTPVSILGNSKTFCKIASGYGHTIGLDKNGRVWGWGYNGRGQLGDNTITQRNTPVSILGVNKTFCSISGGYINTIGLDKNGNVWGWGYNNKGQLGDNSVTQRKTPVSILGINKTFCSITSGRFHSIVLDKNGRVWGWGYNYYGQLGDNSTIQRNTPVSILGVNKTFCSISAGYYHSIGIDDNGKVWGWGYNINGQLGNNSTTNRATPVSILGINKTFCSISTGYRHTIGLDKNGKVWGWGYNVYGQLGDNSITSRLTPVSILGVNKTFCSISAGYQHSIGIDDNGKVWGWGYNLQGQLGNNGTPNRCTPVSILGVNKTFCKIASGNGHTIGIDDNGRVWCWGNNSNGQLGDNTITLKRTPVSILGVNKTFCSISGGLKHTIGLDKNGRIWGWGYNSFGQLGDNTVISKRTPVSILGVNKTFCSISAGTYHTIGLDKNGRVWGWGYNSNGQLGDNSITSRRTPVSILGINKTFCSISAGYYYFMGIDDNGKVWCWGSNAYGQLGDNSTTQRNTPVSILGVNKTFCSIAGGQYHSVGLDKNGRVWCWGYNSNGQLGDNTITSKRTPVSILGTNKTFCKITSGYGHTIGLDKNGRVWGWGYNAYGQLGDNSTTQRNTPVSILGINKTFCSITSGYNQTIGIDDNGKVWGWGYGFNGQLGNNDFPYRTTPVMITTI